MKVTEKQRRACDLKKEPWELMAEVGFYDEDFLERLDEEKKEKADSLYIYIKKAIESAIIKAWDEAVLEQMGLISCELAQREPSNWDIPIKKRVHNPFSSPKS